MDARDDANDCMQNVTNDIPDQAHLHGSNENSDLDRLVSDHVHKPLVICLPQPGYEQVMEAGFDSNVLVAPTANVNRSGRSKIRGGRSVSFSPTPKSVFCPSVNNLSNESACRFGTITDHVCKTGTTSSHLEAVPCVDAGTGQQLQPTQNKRSAEQRVLDGGQVCF